MWLLAILFLGMAVVSYIEIGITQRYLEGLVIIPIVLLFFTWVRYSTYIEIFNDRQLVNKGYRSFGQDELDIYSIKYIGRAKTFIFKSMGSLMVFFIIDDQGKLRQTALRERAYPTKTLVALLKHLKKINPTMILDEQYESLLDGTFSDNHDWPFSRTPALYSLPEVEAIVKKKIKAE